MKKENPLIDKSLLFAARIIKLNKYLTNFIAKLQISLKETAKS